MQMRMQVYLRYRYLLTQNGKNKFRTEGGQDLKRHPGIQEPKLGPHGVQRHRLQALHKVRDVLVGEAVGLGRDVAPDWALVALLVHPADETLAQPVHELGQLQHVSERRSKNLSQALPGRYLKYKKIFWSVTGQIDR